MELIHSLIGNNIEQNLIFVTICHFLMGFTFATIEVIKNKRKREYANKIRDIF